MKLDVMGVVRPATYKDHAAHKEPVDCLVLGGPFPAGSIDDGLEIYFIIQLRSGKCLYATPDTITFKDKAFDGFSFGGNKNA